jgi:hypothetical protein
MPLAKSLMLLAVCYWLILEHRLHVPAVEVSRLTTLGSEMFKILGRSGLDNDILSWVWDQTITVTFVTIELKANDDGTFSREQGIVALYLAQVQTGLELNEFSRKLMPPHNSQAACIFLDHMLLNPG